MLNTALNNQSARSVNGLDICILGDAKKVNGVQAGIWVITDDKFKGLQIGGAAFCVNKKKDGEIQGAQIGFFGRANKIKGLQIFGVGATNKMNGLQITGVGVINTGTNLQLGGYLFNSIEGISGKNRRSIILNYGN